ncbi:hypothetical protein [Mucilaginibacter flavidus]|uniref:hypothetical protein n=1 Tax=Mucilaginibacter flavidus TaxID=2949309 RepID=UPI002092AE86|nr:hypothetical protein [Mucilaginibacter flavidus]MCO5950930.1 hypothetical protein [Mucilaginibacter flavidus]
MENQIHPNQHKSTKATHKPVQHVFVLRDWKEYIGESGLIIFSVLLALILTEFINNQHEKSQTKELLSNIKDELVKNKQNEEEQYVYQQGVLRRIDSVLNSSDLQQKILAGNEFNFKYLAPSGVVYHDLSKVAWQVGQTHNIFLKIDFKLVERLTDIYDNQARIDKLEDKLGNILLSYESRRPENIRETLILIRDNYHGWAFDRAPSLIKKYDDAIKAIDKEL